MRIPPGTIELANRLIHYYSVDPDVPEYYERWLRDYARPISPAVILHFPSHMILTLAERTPQTGTLAALWFLDGIRTDAELADLYEKVLNSTTRRLEWYWVPRALAALVSQLPMV